MSKIRSLGASGLSIPPLVLGGNVFGWTADRAQSFAVLDRLVAAGATMMIDTADMYSSWVPGNRGGESETIIGEWLKAGGRRGDVLIATKVGKLDGPGGSGLAPARIAAAIDESLRRLGIDQVDLYYAHGDDPAVPQDEVALAFDAIVKAGKARAIGASNFTADRLSGALAASDAGGLARYSVLQPLYNLLERDQFEGPLQQLCLAENIGVLPYYGLASGFLTGKYRTEADLAKGARGQAAAKYLKGGGQAVLAAMDAVAAETGASLAAIALAWLAAQPGVTAPIASAVSPAQLDELLASLDLVLSDDQIARLDAAGR